MAGTEDSTVRRFLPAAALVAPLPLSACYIGPTPVQYAALAVVNGRPTAVVAACGRSTVSVGVYPNDDSAGDDAYSWAVTVTLAHRVRDVEVELLPVQLQGPAADIDRRPPPVHLRFVDRRLEGSTAPRVAFTTADLSRMGTGQVLAPADHKRSKVVSRDQSVNERCVQR